MDFFLEYTFHKVIIFVEGNGKGERNQLQDGGPSRLFLPATDIEGD
jgi:hypothetical protein